MYNMRNIHSEILTSLFKFSGKGSTKDQKLWDSFQDPPPPQTGGSAVDTKRFSTCKKLLKLTIYLMVFLVILTCGVLAKSIILLMASHIKPGTRVRYCNIRRKVFLQTLWTSATNYKLKILLSVRVADPEQEFHAVIPIEQNIAWIWALVFAFSVPEVGAFIRAARISFFRNVGKAHWHEFGLVGKWNTVIS